MRIIAISPPPVKTPYGVRPQPSNPSGHPQAHRRCFGSGILPFVPHDRDVKPFTGDDRDEWARESRRMEMERETREDEREMMEDACRERYARECRGCEACRERVAGMSDGEMALMAIFGF